MIIIKIIFAIIYALFLPGYVFSFVFFRALDWLERVALSFALSIALVPLLVFYLNLAGVKINLISIISEIAGLLLLGGAIIFIRRKFSI